MCKELLKRKSAVLEGENTRFAVHYISTALPGLLQWTTVCIYGLLVLSKCSVRAESPEEAEPSKQRKSSWHFVTSLQGFTANTHMSS